MNVAELVTDLLDVGEDDTNEVTDLEIRPDAELVTELINVLDGGILLVCVVDVVEVLEEATLLLDVSVFKGFVADLTEVAEIVFDGLVLRVDVVEAVIVFVPCIVFEEDDEADNVLDDDDEPVFVRDL